MAQTKLQSLLESAINIAIGIAIGFLANITVLPLFGYPVTIADGVLISVVFTIVSLVRSYLIRRYFNKRHG